MLSLLLYPPPSSIDPIITGGSTTQYPLLHTCRMCMAHVPPSFVVIGTIVFDGDCSFLLVCVFSSKNKTPRLAQQTKTTHKMNTHTFFFFPGWILGFSVSFHTIFFSNKIFPLRYNQSGDWSLIWGLFGAFSSKGIVLLEIEKGRRGRRTHIHPSSRNRKGARILQLFGWYRKRVSGSFFFLLAYPYGPKWRRRRMRPKSQSEFSRVRCNGTSF